MNLVARVGMPRVKRRTLATFLLALVALGAVAAVAVAQSPPRTGIVISEFRFRGPAGASDEFVELRNSSTAPIEISGFKLQGCSSGTPGTATDRATVPGGVTLNPGQSFLFANSTMTTGFSGMVTPDQTFTTGITDTSATNFSGAQVVDTAGMKVDGVGAPQSPCREGTGIVTPAAPTGGAALPDSSFERILGTQDTNNNSTDFQPKAPSDPQNRTTNPGTAPGGGAPGPRTGIVISEFRVRGPGGGNDEFFELRNTSAEAIDISGFELQGCASGDGNATRRAVVENGTTLDPGESFLFANNSSSGGFSGGVPADQAFGTGISDFLVDNQSGARIVDGETVVDGVGSPTSPCREGTGILTPATPNTDSSFERLGGTQDTDNNSTDFQPKTPSDPQNTSEAPDEAEPTPISEIQGDGQTSPFVEEPASSSSPGRAGGETVTIEGVVTGVDDEVGQSNSGRIFENERGIFVQEEAADQDADPDTSEAIFVGFVREPKTFYTPGVGQVVRVTGRVRELFGFTIIEEQIGQEPERVGVTPQPMPTQINEQQAEGQESSDPDAEEAAGRDYYESLESMRVEFESATANSGGTNKFDELFLTPGSDPDAGPGGEDSEQRDRVFREGGDPEEENSEVPELFATDEDAGSGNPMDPGSSRTPRSTTAVLADLFDTADDVVGPFAFNFGNYKVMVQEDREPAVDDEAGVVYPFQTRPENDGGLKSFEQGEDVRVVSYNINNFFDNEDDPDTDDEVDETSDREQEKRVRAVDAINNILKRPDVISLQEVENEEVLDRLAEDLGGYTGVLFEGRDNRGIDNAFLIKDGGEDGGTGGGGTGGGTGGGGTGGGQAVVQEPGGGDSIVSFSNPRQLGLDEDTPDRVPDDQECSDEDGKLFDRPPISVDIEVDDGRKFTVFGSHFASKGGQDERRQCREEQAEFLSEQVEEVQDGTREDGELRGGEEPGGEEPGGEGEGSEAIVAADLNAFEDEEPLEILEEEGGLDNLWDEEEAEMRYSFQFQGKLQTLDHILVTEGLNEDLQAFQYAHFNVDYYEREAPGPETPSTDGHKLSVHDAPIFTLGPVGDDGSGGNGNGDNGNGDNGNGNGKNDNDKNGNGKGNGRGNEGNGSNRDDADPTPGLGGVLGVQSPVFALQLQGVRSCSRSRGSSFVARAQILGALPGSLRVTLDGRKVRSNAGRPAIGARILCRRLSPGLHRVRVLGIDRLGNRLTRSVTFRVRRAR